MTRPLPPAVVALERRLGVPPGALEGAEKERAEAALDDATALALAEVATSLAASWELDAPAIVELVILKAARREYENPRGLIQETLGEHSVGISEASGVYLTRREISHIVRAASGRIGFIGSIQTPSAYK